MHLKIPHGCQYYNMVTPIHIIYHVIRRESRKFVIMRDNYTKYEDDLSNNLDNIKQGVY